MESPFHFHIISTVTESILRSEIRSDLIEAGTTMFRINGAHGTVRDIERLVGLAGRYLPVLLDLPCSKVRTVNLLKPLYLRKGAAFSLKYKQVNFPQFSRHLEKGDLLNASDGKLTFKVVKNEEEDRRVIFKALSDGTLENRKGLHCQKEIPLPFLSPDDYLLIDIAKKSETVDWVGLSYVRNGEEVKMVEDELDDLNIWPIPKIETRDAIENLDSILKYGEHVIVDRGDLSAEVGIDSIGYYQDRIIDQVRDNYREVILATQFLHSTIATGTPSIPEISDLYNCIKKGIHGIQLSDEIVFGSEPQHCVEMVSELARRYSPN